MEIDATSSGSSDSNPGHFPGGLYGENLFFPGLGKSRADFDAYFCPGKRSDGDKAGETSEGEEFGVKGRGVFGGDLVRKVEELAEIRKSQGGFYGVKKSVENEILLNGVTGFGKKAISFSPDQVGSFV